MNNSGLSRQLGLRSLTLAVVTSTIGSGWLFAPLYAARSAGPWALLAWLLGGGLAFALALVFAELGSLVNSSGALAEIPLLSHGRTAGFIGGWCAWVAYLALPTIEVLAVMEYLASSLPWLTQTSTAGGVSATGQVLSGAGMGVATTLLVLLAWINLAGVGWLARWIDGLTSWKLIVPLLVSVTLIAASGHWGNLSSAPPNPQGLVTAISSGGILFSLLGFRTAMDLAGEARRPQRTVPLAMALGLGISLAIYLVLQLAFLVAVPPGELSGGWGALRLSAHGGPLVALVLGLGFGWMAKLLLIDALISPTATAMTYMGAAARVGWAMGRERLLPVGLSRLNQQAVPAVALLFSLGLGVLLLLSGPGWQQVVSFLTATLVIALAMGPVSLVALRHQLPSAQRGYRLAMGNGVVPRHLCAGHLGDQLVRHHGASRRRGGGAGAGAGVSAADAAATATTSGPPRAVVVLVSGRNRGDHCPTAASRLATHQPGALGPGGVSPGRELRPWPSPSEP